jgi:hypothetical protein
MQEKQKEKRPSETPEEPEKIDDSWAGDQRSHSYYYDDSHGYEVFKDEADDDDGDDGDE